MFRDLTAPGCPARTVVTRLKFSAGLFAALILVGCQDAEVEPLAKNSSKYRPASAASTDKEDNSAASGGTSANPPTPTNRVPGNVPANSVSGQVTPSPTATGDSATPSSAPSSPAQADSPPAPDRLDPANLPDGTADELLAKIDELAQQRPSGLTRQQLVDDMQNLLLVRQRLAEKVMKGKATPEQKTAAAQAKVNVLATKLQMRIPGADGELIAFCQTLAKDEVPDCKRLGRVMLFQIQVGSIEEGNQEDFEKVFNELKAMLAADGPIPQLFQPSQNFIEFLAQNGQGREAAEVAKFVGETFVKSDDKELADAGKQTLALAKSFNRQVELNDRLRAVREDADGAEQELVGWVKKNVAEDSSPDLFATLTKVANIVEYDGRYATAESLYDMVGTAFSKHADPQIAEQAAGMVENAKKRVGLVGKPLPVEGATLDGKAFDWTKYKGKIVLLDFWATWCRPCLAEIPNIRRSFEAHREEGFEVIGVNLDENVGDLERFLAVQPLPWPTITSADANAAGFQNPLAQRCGVEAIPFVVLIGRDGKVLDIHVRGPKLEQRLVALLETETGAKPAVPKTEAGAPAENGDAKKTSSVRPKTRVGGGFVAAEESPKTAAPEAKKDSKPAAANDEKPVADNFKKEDAVPTAEENPYSAREDLTTAELIDFVLNMQEKPRSIQARRGFTDAVVEAADRVLKSTDASDKFRQIATIAKIEELHKDACRGNLTSDQKLTAFIATLTMDARPKVAAEVKFLSLERRVIDADKGPAEQISAVLDDLRKYCGAETLTARHLRMASAAVQVINRIEDDDEREKLFQEFGKLFAKSESRELARYGRKLAKPPESKQSDLVGKPLDLKGTTASGAAFDWKSYRGKAVIVDFWATWCGPCVREMPNVKALYEKYHKQGFEIVGVSLDNDLDALNEFIMQHEIPWATLAGDGSQELAQQYGVRGIPTMMLVDQDGKVVAVSHRSGDLIPKLEKLLEGKKT